MDINKRYCWPTQRKRKQRQKTAAVPIAINNYISSSDEERDFKLRKFFESTRDFENGKEDCSRKDNVCGKDESILIQKTIRKRTIKKKSPSKNLMKGRQFQNGFETKFYCNGRTKQTTSKLDEKLHEIICLSNKNKNQSQCIYKKSSQTAIRCKHGHIEPKRPLNSRLSPRSDDQQQSLSPSQAVMRRDLPESASTGQKCKSLSQLDKELYPIFTRVVSDSSAKTKFDRDHSRKKEYSQEEYTCLSSDTQKTRISVATSPLPSPEIASLSSQNDNLGQEPTFTDINFVYTKPKSTLEFLEETIGPSSSSTHNTHHSLNRSPDLHQSYRPHDLPGFSHNHPSYTSAHLLQNYPLCTSAQVRQNHFLHASADIEQYYQPQTSSYLQPNYLPLLSPPVVTNTHPASFTHLSKYFNESPCPRLDTYNWKSKVFDSGGSDARLSLFKNFLPPIEEESPEFRYFPRKMF